MNLRFKLKGSVKKKHFYGVVYEIDCPGCDVFTFGRAVGVLEKGSRIIMDEIKLARSQTTIESGCETI